MSQLKEELALYRKISSEFKTVLDVGCRDDIEYYQIKPDCEYHLFEPNTEALTLLYEKTIPLNDSKIIINEFGLSDEPKLNQIYYKNVQSFQVHHSVRSIDSGDRFNLSTIDEYVRTKNIKKIDLLKTDCEGMDFKVLLGGKQTLVDDIITYIQLEMTSPLKQYTDLCPNFNFYLMMEPVLLNVIHTLNETTINFDNLLTPLTDEVIDFVDNVLTPTGNGGNLFGVNKKVNFNFEEYNKEQII